ARRPRLLVLGAGPAQLGLLEAAHRRGLHVIAADRDPQAIGFVHADERAVISTDDEPALERLARAREVDGLVSPGADWSVGVAARIAERVGLPHPIDAATASLATSKSRQRQQFGLMGVPQPRAVVAARAAVAALGVIEGPSYTQIRLAPDGPRVMEVAARLGGGHDAELVEAATGVPLNDLALDFALGRPIGPTLSGSEPRAEGACVVFLVAPVGELSSVTGVEEAEATEGVVWVRAYRRRGWLFG